MMEKSINKFWFCLIFNYFTIEAIKESLLTFSQNIVVHKIVYLVNTNMLKSIFNKFSNLHVMQKICKTYLNQLKYKTLNLNAICIGKTAQQLFEACG